MSYFFVVQPAPEGVTLKQMTRPELETFLVQEQHHLLDYIPESPITLPSSRSVLILKGDLVPVRFEKSNLVVELGPEASDIFQVRTQKS